jgi:hypothetical protein
MEKKGKKKKQRLESMHVKLYTLAHEVLISLNKLQKLRYKRGLKSIRIQGESSRLHIRINTRKQFLPQSQSKRIESS